MINVARFFSLRGLAVATALVVNVSLLYLLYDILPSQTSSSWSHITYAYNFYKHGTLTQITDQIAYKTQKAIPVGLNKTPEKPSVNDTVGYGFLVGSIWKLTGSLDLIDIQILQIILFCVMMYLIYGVALLLFESLPIAFMGSLLVTLWYPLVSLNVRPARDIWGYYGGVVLTYVLLKFFLSKNYSYKKVFLAAAFFAFCQFLRPNIIGQCMTLCAALFVVFYLYKRTELKRCIKAISLVFLANGLFFWVPFITFNKVTYDRYFVGPFGHALLASLGTVENPWGLECSDGVIVDYVKADNCLVGKKSCGANPAAHEEVGFSKFLHLLKQNPWVYVCALGKSIKSALFFELKSIQRFYQACLVDGLFFTAPFKEMKALTPGLFALKSLSISQLRFCE